jgi:hypothetical protein
MPTQYQIITLIFGALAPTLALALTPCPPGATTLPWVGAIPLFIFVLLGVALWVWLHVKVARRTNFRNRVIVHIMAFLLFCGSIVLGLFSYFHFAVLNCF